MHRALEHIRSMPGSCVVVIDDYFVDVTAYLGEHVRLCLRSLLMLIKLYSLVEPQCCASIPYARSKIMLRHHGRLTADSSEFQPS